MSVTSGFFNSLNHDRRYNAQQMSAIFDGIINDGVFANIGVAFKVTADTGVTINIGEGKAWFTSAWVYNDAPLPMTLEGSEVVLDRIDAVVIDVDHNESVRFGSIKVVKGTPSSSPKRPTMVSDKKHSQHPLAYIYRKAGSTTITQANITNMVGTSSCPYITGILQVQNIDNIVAQWNAQWNEWYAAKIAETDSDASVLMAEMKSEFEIWFNDIQTLLDDDVATALAAQVAELQGKFDTLAREGAVYDTIEDSDFDPILGSDGTPIQGKTVFGGGGTNVSKPSDIGAVAVDGTTPMEGPLDMNTYRVQNVSEPKVDTDAATAGYAKMVASRASSPRNLLDNSDFRNPVNQRGTTNYTSGYGIDRWVATGSKTRWAIVDGGLEVYCADTTSQPYIDQRIPEEIVSYTTDNGKKYTVAAKVNGSIYSTIVTVGGSEVLNVPFGSIGFAYSPSASLMVVRLNLLTTEASIIEWVALYEGEYTAETLPMYQSKGYAAELAECQRYYQVLFDGVLSSAGYVTNAGKNLEYSLKASSMRDITPTLRETITALTIRGTSGYLLQGASSGFSTTLNGSRSNAKCGHFSFQTVLTTALSENNIAAGIQMTGVIAISADL